MRTDDFANKKRPEMLEVTRLMLADQYDLIEGCRKIVALGSLVGLRDDPALLPFSGFESETDHFPRGAVREHFDADYLRKLDSEAHEYLEDATTEILRSCTDLLSRFDA